MINCTPTSGCNFFVHMKIKEMFLEERPREKMKQRGLDALTDVELLALVLHSGSGKKNVIELARELYAEHSGSLCSLSAASPDRLCNLEA